MKNICVFGSSSNAIEKNYLEHAEQLGEILARRGCTVIFGAGNRGIMGATGRGVRAAGGTLIGVSPDFFIDMDVLDHECTELIITETMRERKAIMEDKADAFVICPGGIGTFEEFFEVITLKQLGRHSKPIIIYNDNGYYDPMLAMMKASVGGMFMRKEVNGLYTVAETIDEVLSQLDEYKPGFYSKY